MFKRRPIYPILEPLEFLVLHDGSGNKKGQKYSNSNRNLNIETATRLCKTVREAKLHKSLVVT